MGTSPGRWGEGRHHVCPPAASGETNGRQRRCHSPCSPGDMWWGWFPHFKQQREKGGETRNTGQDVRVSERTTARAHTAGISPFPQPCPGLGGIAREGRAKRRAAPPPARSLSGSPPIGGGGAPRQSRGRGQWRGRGGKKGGRPRGPCRVRRRTASRGEARGGPRPSPRCRGGPAGGGRRAGRPPRRGGAAPAGAVRGGAGLCGVGRGLGALARRGARLPGRRAAERKANNAVKICLQKIDNCWIKRIQV